MCTECAQRESACQWEEICNGTPTPTPTVLLSYAAVLRYRYCLPCYRPKPLGISRAGGAAGAMTDLPSEVKRLKPESGRPRYAMASERILSAFHDSSVHPLFSQRRPFLLRSASAPPRRRNGSFPSGGCGPLEHRQRQRSGVGGGATGRVIQFIGRASASDPCQPRRGIPWPPCAEA